MVRRPISKKLRFEVFKRDSFTCQYCGQKAPDVVLELDHIIAVASGGDDDILNLITSCRPCNSGKSDRALKDTIVLDKQRQQLEELNERREQLEMMIQWRDGLRSLADDTVIAICQRLDSRTGISPNESGKGHIRRWLRRFSVDEVLTAVDEACDVWLRYEDDEVTKESWETMFLKIPTMASIARQSTSKPYLRKLLYVQGILRRRCDNKWLKCVDALESFLMDGVPEEELERMAKSVDSWEEFDREAQNYLDAWRENPHGQS